jgi:hypothetical protein
MNFCFWKKLRMDDRFAVWQFQKEHFATKTLQATQLDAYSLDESIFMTFKDGLVRVIHQLTVRIYMPGKALQTMHFDHTVFKIPFFLCFGRKYLCLANLIKN